MEQDAPSLLAERKAKLIAEGVLYRQALLQSKHALHAGLQPGSFAKNVLGQTIMAAYQLFRNGNGVGLQNVNVQTLLPVLISTISALSGKSCLKPLVRGAALLGVAGIVARFVARNRTVQ